MPQSRHRTARSSRRRHSGFGVVRELPATELQMLHDRLYHDLLGQVVGRKPTLAEIAWCSPLTEKSGIMEQTHQRPAGMSALSGYRELAASYRVAECSNASSALSRSGKRTLLLDSRYGASFRSLGLIGGTGVLTVWAGMASAWLEAWGPIGYVAAGLAGALAAALCLAGVGIWRERLSRIRLNSQLELMPKSINPLDNNFTKQTIRLQDFFSPFMESHSGKTFIGCHIHGPANVLLVPSITFNGNDMSRQCDYVLIDDHVGIRNAIVFCDCLFQDCTFFYVTLLVPIAMKENFEQSAQGGVRWLNPKIA